MFKIGEFSRITQVTVRMLRYYDEMGLLKPAHIEPWTGYRMYSADQIPALNRIIYLRDSGFNVAEIAGILDHDSDSFITQQLMVKYEQIENTIREEQEKLKKIQIAQEELHREKRQIHYQISIKSIPSYQVLAYRKVIPDYYAEGKMWKELSAFAGEQQISISTDTFSIYHDPEYKERDVDVEVCVPVREMGEDKGDFFYYHTPPEPNMACTMVYGDFTNIAGVYLEFAGWLQEHSQYKMGDTSRQIVHRGPWNEEDSRKYLVEIQVPLREKNAE